MVLLRTHHRNRGFGTNERRVWNKKVYNYQVVFSEFPHIMKCQHLPFQHLGNHHHNKRIKQVHNTLESNSSRAERTEINDARCYADI